MEKIITNLWFDEEAEEAANFYTSIFKNSRVIATTLVPKSAEEVSGKRAGSVMFVEFELDGERFIALNGGPEFKFNESVSLMVPCQDQAEIDYFWNKLTAGILLLRVSFENPMLCAFQQWWTSPISSILAGYLDAGGPATPRTTLSTNGVRCGPADRRSYATSSLR